MPEVNEPYYLGKAIHFWDPHWASSDWFLQTTDTQLVLLHHDRLAGAAVVAHGPGVDAAAGHLGDAGLVVAAAQCRRCAAAWTSLLTAALFLFLLQHFNVAGEWVVGGAESKCIAYALVFLALRAMVEGFWNRMWLLLGLATAFHALGGRMVGRGWPARFGLRRTKRRDRRFPHGLRRWRPFCWPCRETFRRC